MTRKFPTLYEIDDDHEATGTVYHFCHIRCMTLYLLAHFNDSDLNLCGGCDGEAEVDDQEICSECGTPFYPEHFIT